MEIAKDIGKNMIGIYAMDMVGANQFIANTSSTPMKIIKVGGVYYLIQLGIEGFDKMAIPNISIKKAIDDTVFYGAGIYIANVLGINNLLSKVDVGNNTIDNVLQSAILFEGVKVAGEYIENSALSGIKNVSSLIGIHF